MAGLSATYIDATCFSVVGDLTNTFVVGRRVKVDCGVDGYKFGTIESSIVDGTTTVVCLSATSDDLTANITQVWYGIVSEGVTGSVPIHSHDGAEGSGGLVECCREDELASVQARRTTNFSVPSSFGTKITYDTTDIENDASVVEHSATTSRITFKEPGLYLVGYTLNGVQYSADASTETHLEGRVLLNNTTPIPSSVTHDGNYYSLTGNTSEDTFVECSFLYDFQAGDYIEVQVWSQNLRVVTGFTATITEDVIFWAIKQEGSKGEQGPTGSGSNINVYDDGVLVSGSPFSALNFIGVDTTASATISGGVDIEIPPGVVLQVDTTNITRVLQTNTVIDEATTPTSSSGVVFGANEITLTRSDSKVRVQLIIPCDNDNDAGDCIALIHRGTTVLAVAGALNKKEGMRQIVFDFYDTPGSVGPHTYSVRVGVSSNTGSFNRTDGDATPFGGTLFTNNCWLTLTEIAA
jgi:hypothetical protein